ncbi:MAG: hypothetical protein HY013_17300 [Candidatus Solibacter usitatus]|nr:hypothetical protein [Candidatus Solibacter usitatus]
MLPIDGRASPQLSVSTLQVEAGSTARVDVSWRGTALNGQYQGFIRVDSSTNDVRSFIPYWYSAASTTPSGISLLDPPSTGPAGETATVFLRVVDPSGNVIPGAALEVTPAPVNIVRDPDYLGLVLLTLPLQAGENAFWLKSGDVTRTLTIVGK